MTVESKNLSKAEQFIQQLNASNAKKIALVLVLGFIAYHGVLHLKYGIDSCKWLLSDGRFKGDNEWQPYGCMLHHYTQTDTRRCLRYLAFWGTHNHFVFIGDSRIREMYQAFINHLQYSTSDLKSSNKPSLKDADASFSDTKLRLQVDYYYTPYVSQEMIEHFKTWRREQDPPTVIIAGSGTETIKRYNASDGALKSYLINLTRLVQPIDGLSERKTKVVWAMQAPVQEDKFVGALRAVTNAQIDAYNKAALEVLSYSAVNIWSSTRLVSKGLLDTSPDGLHSNALALKHDTQILLNMYCNDHMNYNDGTCCSSPEQCTAIQAVTFGILGICTILATALVVHRCLIRRCSSSHEYAPLSTTPESIAATTTSVRTPLTALATLGLIMSYFYLCDRTNFFMKENKYYSEFSFWLPVGYMFALGLFFTEDSRFTKVLHRDQTLELKGWMQLVILIYHMTGASHVVPIYMHIKVLISAYLFMSGYGHFCYIWQTGNVGLVRFVQVLFKLNFMTVILCLCMNRPYQFYYYVPLLSFWFCMVYLLLAVPPQITSQSTENNSYHYLYLVLKFVILFSIITILYMSEVFFEKIFVTRPWKALFVTTDDDIHEWWYRWKLDRYSMTYGMVFAAVFLSVQKLNLVNDNNHSNLFSRGISLSATLLAFIFLGIYTIFTFLCHNKQNCDEVHTYIVFFPIVGYIVLRNISGFLRTRYSSLFAWFGKISIELFVCQYHIWLAADTHGVLVLIPSYPVVNVLVTSFIFVCASHEVHRLTHILLPYAVPSDWKLVLRNIILFLAILVPIGIHDGMF